MEQHANDNGYKAEAGEPNGTQPARQASQGDGAPPALDPFLVYFKRDDPECPFYFSMTRKWSIVLVLAAQIIWIAGLGSSWSPANTYIADEFGVSPIVARIPQAMYLVGFSVGPVLLSPIAEDYGRKWTFFVCLLLTYIFQIPIVLAPNYATLVICRFIAGFIASPIFNSCCNVPDLWRTTDEGIAFFALNIWAFSAELIVVAPIWGAYIVLDYGWRWLWGISALVGAGLSILFVLLVPETRHTVLLERRARRLRKETGDSRYHALGALDSRRTISQILRETLYRPVFMLLTEPIVNLFAIWDGLNYGVIYLAVEAVPLIYEEHGFHEPEVEFLFLSIVVGYILGIALIPIQLRFRHAQQRKKGGGELAPESKLTGWGFFAGVAFPVSLYLFAWLALPSIHWFASLVPLALFGCASHVLFIMISDYTVDSYGHLASSAVTGQSFARELMSAGLIIAGQDFYENVGYPEATTILAAFATILGVLPFVFAKYGPRIRERSAYSLEIKKAAKEAAEREKLE